MLRQAVEQMSMPSGDITNHISFSTLVFAKTPFKTPGVFVAL